MSQILFYGILLLTTIGIFFKVRLARRAAVVTVLTLALTFLGSLIASTNFFSLYVYPESFALDDFDLTDYAYTRLRPQPSTEERILLVNFGHLSRKKVAEQINTISKFHPKVIGIDAIYNCEDGLRDTINCPQLLDTLGNRMLRDAILKSGHVVLASHLFQTDSFIPTNESIVSDSIETSEPIFQQYSKHGFISLPIEKGRQEIIRVVRSLWPQQIIEGKRQLAFSAQVAMQYDSVITNKFLRRNLASELINYRGNIRTGEDTINRIFKTVDSGFFTAKGQSKYSSLSESLVKDKIVLLGYLGETTGANDFDDGYYTPLNKVFAGRSNPDMFGVVVHANILSMILNQDYIDQLTNTDEWIIAYLACWIHIMVLLFIYQRVPQWFDLLGLVIIISQLAFYSFIRLQLFAVFSFKMELYLTIGSLAVASIAVNIFNSSGPLIKGKLFNWLLGVDEKASINNY